MVRVVLTAHLMIKFLTTTPICLFLEIEKESKQIEARKINVNKRQKRLNIEKKIYGTK